MRRYACRYGGQRHPYKLFGEPMGGWNFIPPSHADALGRCFVDEVLRVPEKFNRFRSSRLFASSTIRVSLSGLGGRNRHSRHPQIVLNLLNDLCSAGGERLQTMPEMVFLKMLEGAAR